MAVTIASLLCVGTVAVAGGAAAATGGGTGLHGHVVISPAYPVCQADIPCTRPAGHVLLRFSRTGHRPVAIRTRANGSYRIALAPGRYRVSTPTANAMLPALDPRAVTVPRTRLARVDFTLDVGIR